jgi:hypothetical protein
LLLKIFGSNLQCSESGSTRTSDLELASHCVIHSFQRIHVFHPTIISSLLRLFQVQGVELGTYLRADEAGNHTHSFSTIQPYQLSRLHYGTSTRSSAVASLAAMMGSWLHSASRSLSDVAMVPRLRVAVRVVSEDEYLSHLAEGPPGPGLYPGEKKFAVVIQNPQQWQIGHLAAEVKRQYKKIYGR